MKTSSYYLSVGAAAATGLIAAPVINMVTNLLGIDASLAPSWVSYGALFGAFTGMLVLICAVVASASNAIQFALAGAVSSLLISLLLSGVVSFYLIAAAIFGALVGTGQYFGARLIEKGNID